MKRFVCLLPFLALGCSAQCYSVKSDLVQDATLAVLRADGPSVTIDVGGVQTKRVVSFDESLDIFRLICDPSEKTTVVYSSGIDALTFEVLGLDRKYFSIIDENGLGAKNEIRCLPPPARYAGSYQPDRPTAATYPEDLDPLIETYFAPDRAGVLVGGWKNNKPIYQRAFGLANLETQRKRNLSDPFEIASLSKEFTAVAIMQLIESDQLGSDDPVATIFPNLPWGGDITIRHLLTHTSGLGNRTYHENYTALSKFNAEEALRQLGSTVPDFEPGSSYQYSNAGMTLLALIAEEISGESREDYIKEKILKPAGMAETRFLWELSEEELHFYTAGYVESGAQTTRVPIRMHRTASYGSGDMVSTLNDLRKWHNALRQHTLMSRESFAKMVKPVILADGTVSERGFAFNLGRIGGERVIYNSGDIYTHTRHAFFLDQDISIIVNANVDIEGNFDIAGRVRDQILGKMKNTYELDMYGTTIDVRRDY